MVKITQLEIPKLTMLDHAYQVGAPGNPYGITMNFEMEWTHNNWTKHEDDSLTFVEIVTPKKYSMKLTQEQLEALLLEWKAGCIDYEEWLLDLKTKKEIFDFNKEKSRKSWVRKLFRRQIHGSL